MYYPKFYFCLLILITASTIDVHGQEEVRPFFPGGQRAFSQYILKNLKYPEVANLVGLTGKVYVKFTIEKNGAVTHVTPYKCLGAGCESEAVRVISMSPKWRRGLLYGKPARVELIIPVTFKGDKPFEPTKLNELRRSKYGFVFFIKGKTYTVDEAQTILGKSFDPTTVETVENYDNPQYTMPDKKAVYLIVMKDS